MKNYSTYDKPNSKMVGFRLTSEQLQDLKTEAAKQKRTLSNFIKSKLS